jgi:hypothetical protein
VGKLRRLLKAWDDAAPFLFPVVLAVLYWSWEYIVGVALGVSAGVQLCKLIDRRYGV